jgi:Cobalamin biosynthesis protein CobT (nicotinate-mononucleotide:5, 6-dimethylbenzimidazole phosphoribosyltransferase)
MSKSKSIKTSYALSVLYTRCLHRDLKTTNSVLNIQPFDIGLTFDINGTTSYTYIAKSGRPRVVLSGENVKTIAKLPERFDDKKTFSPYYDAIVKAFWGLDLHEMGHQRYTDMYDKTISEYPNSNYIGFLHTLFNTLEDPIIERAMCDYYDEMFPTIINPREYFNFMKERIFMPQAEEYTYAKNVNNFMTYLLLLVRCGKKNIKEENEIFEKYKGGLIPRIKAIFLETSGTKRIKLSVELGEWIIDNIKEFDWKTVEKPEHSSTGLGGGGGTGRPIATPGSSGAEVEDTLSGSGSSSSEESESEDGSKKRSLGDESGGGKPEAENVIEDLLCADHVWLTVKDEYEVIDPTIIDDINKKIEDYEDPIKAVSDFLKLFHGRHRPRRTPGFTSGKLNVFRAMQDDLRDGCDTKIFCRDIQRGKDVDLAVTLVVDNSGSMHGQKSEIATQAALVLAQACEWSNIPFECLSFTQDFHDEHLPATFIEKSFEDKFEDAKPFFGITDSSLRGKLYSDNAIAHWTFCDNTDEVNIFHIWKRLEKVEHKNKLLFVMSDGETVGSQAALRRIVETVENSGIPVIGIGILSNAVEHAYKERKVFKSMKDLQANLADFLIETLSRYAS